jgi:peptide/nickel transport system substrate-binding protein
MLAGAVSIGGAAAIGLTGCGQGAVSAAGNRPRRGGTLLAARIEPTDGFKLDAGTANPSYQVDMAVMEPLLRSRRDGLGILPGLAESWSYDARAGTYTMRLARGARFSDGSPVTPADVAFSADIWKAGPNYGASYAAIKSVTTVDSRTFRFNLTSPNSALPDFLTWSVAGIIPKNFGGRPESDFWQHPVGAGPFRVTQWSTGGSIKVVRNPHYYRPGRPYLDAVTNLFTSDPTQRSLQFRSRQADVVEGVGPDEARLYPKASLLAPPRHFTDFLTFNTTRAPFNDVRARQAVAYAINYRAIADGLYKGYAEQPLGFLPPNVTNWAPPSKPYYRHDSARAAQLIAASGLSRHHVQLTFLTSISSFTLVAQLVAQNLRSLGVRVSLAPTDYGTFIGNVSAGKFDIGLWGLNAISPDVIDPTIFVDQTHWLYSGYPNASLTALIQDYQKATSPASKRAIVTKIQDLSEKEVPALSLDHFSDLFAVQPTVHGIAPTPFGTYYYDEVWKD